MEPAAVGGFIDNLIGKYIKDMLANAAFDYKVFLGHPETKNAANALAISAKAAAKLPFDVDDKAIDMALAALVEVLDQYKNQGPVRVGVSSVGTIEDFAVGAKRSKEDVEKALKEVGIDPLTIGSIVMLILRYAPDLIAMIKKLFNK